jgi:hypothetical protein
VLSILKRLTLLLALVGSFGTLNVLAQLDPLSKVASLVTLKPNEIKPELERIFGKAAKIAYNKEDEDWTATTIDYTVSVQPYKGKVLAISVHFKRSVPANDIAARLGFPNRPPSGRFPGALRWDHVLPGVDELSALIDPRNSGMTVHIFIAPDKARWDAWGRGDI